MLDFLQARIDPDRLDCPYRAALNEAVGYARLSDADKGSIDMTRPCDEWPPIETLVKNLTQEYSRLLDIRIKGHSEPDFLLWNVVDVPRTFALSVAQPDCEHLCLAVLVLEGVLPDVATPNWDGLIEAAVSELTRGPVTPLSICVSAEDLRNQRRKTRLLKFHGCAIKAAADPTQFRSLLIARYSQITHWQHNPAFAAMRAQLTNLATTSPTLMIGLSAQDVNIQGLFSSATEQMRWTWPTTPPAHIFATDSLDDGHRNILRVVYGQSYDSDPTVVEASCLFRAYAKQALTALVLHLLSAKLSGFVMSVGSPKLSDSARTELGRGLIHFRNRISQSADADPLTFIRAFVERNSRIMSLFREGGFTSGSGLTYQPRADAYQLVRMR